MSTTPVEELPAFEGQDVISSSGAITKAGDGLSDALEIDKYPWHIGETVHAMVELVVTNVQHKPIKDTDCLTRKHTLELQTLVVVLPEVAEDTIAQQRIRLQSHKDEKAGAIPMSNPDTGAAIGPEAGRSPRGKAKAEKEAEAAAS